MIKFLSLDDNGNLLGIYNDDGEGLVRMSVPDDYPEVAEWVPGERKFNNGLEKRRLVLLREAHDCAVADCNDTFELFEAAGSAEEFELARAEHIKECCAAAIDKRDKLKKAKTRKALEEVAGPEASHH